MAVNPGGVGFYFTPEGGTVEVHASTCAHCQRITEFPSRRRMMEHVEICRSCMRLICLECHGKSCQPALRKIEIEEAVARRRRWE